MGRPKHPDQEHVARVKAYNRSKSQARYRKEYWDLDKENYFKLWDGYWNKRGRGSDCYCMIQRIPGEGWTPHNVQIVKRSDFVTVIQKQNIMKVRNA